MIDVHVYRRGTQIVRFTVSGHAGYAESGQDIVCSAVSALVYNAVNSCEKFVHAKLDAVDDGDTIDCRVPKLGDFEARSVQLLLDSMVFGLEQTASSYPQYVKLYNHKQS